MKNKVLQLLILFCFACFGVARAEEVFVGAATTAINYLPSNCYYNYSMTQQIYTADEIGTSGLISSISFYCTTCSANRTLDIYLVSTEKTTFSNSTDWIPVSAFYDCECGFSLMLLQRVPRPEPLLQRELQWLLPSGQPCGYDESSWQPSAPWPCSHRSLRAR